MKLTEVINQYNENKDKVTLYKNLDSTTLKLSETLDVLKYTLNEDFSEKDYYTWKDSVYEYTPFDCDGIDINDIYMLGYEDWLRENNLTDSNLDKLKEDMNGYSGRSTHGKEYDSLEQYRAEQENRKNSYNRIYMEKIANELKYLSAGDIVYGPTLDVDIRKYKVRPLLVYSKDSGNSLFFKDRKGTEWVCVIPLTGYHGKSKDPTYNLRLNDSNMGEDNCIDKANLLRGDFFADIGVLYHEILEDLPKFMIKRELLARKLGPIKPKYVSAIDSSVKEITAKKKEINKYYLEGLKTKILVDEKDKNIYGFVQDPLQFIQKVHNLCDDGVFNILREYLIDGNSKIKKEQVLKKEDYDRIYTLYYRPINWGKRAPHPDLYTMRILEWLTEEEEEKEIVA